MCLNEIAFDFSKYDLLTLQTQHMTIFSSLFFNSVVHNNLEQGILSFLFVEKILFSLCGWWLLKIILTVICIDYLGKSV